jgi:type IV pilus assembly protein PilM
VDPWESEGTEGAKTSIWKKEIGFKRKPKAEVRDAKEEEKRRRREEKEDAKRQKRNEREQRKLEREAGRRRDADDGEPTLSRKERRAAEKERRVEEKAAKATTAGAQSSRPGLRRKKRLVGLKIGSSQLAAARVVNNGHADLIQIAREPLEAGIVVGGEPRQPDELANALREFFKKHKLPRNGVRLGIANNRIGVRTLEIAGIEDAKQLGNAIRFRAQEALPIPLEEAVLDYQVLSVRTDANGQTVRRILLVVAYRDLIDRYVSACRKAGIRLAGIDLEAFGLLRALTVLRDEEGPARAATVIVNVGHDRSTFGVSDGLHCEFTRVLDWGGSKLSIAIARALDLAPSEAVPIKHGLSLVEPVTPSGLTTEQAKSAREAAQRELHAFARELVSALQFYQNQPGSLGIGEVVLTGGTAELPGIDSELGRLIGVPVRVGDPLMNVRLGKKIGSTDHVGSLATGIGLGIEAVGMSAVNLLPSKKEARERRRQPNFVALGGVLGAVAVTAALSLWFLSASGAVSERQSEVDALHAELAAIPAPAPRDTSGDVLEQEKAARVTALSAALGQRIPWDRVLRELSLVTPNDVWLTTLQATSPTSSAATTGGGFSIGGRTYSHDSVARLLARLSLVPDLEQVKLEKSTLNKVEGKDIVEFTIGASIRARGASS